MLFFSDGQPTAFRGSFQNNSVTYDGVAYLQDDCASSIPGVGNQLLKAVPPDGSLNVDPRSTGDGVVTRSCGGRTIPSTRWFIFDTMPVPGYAPTACVPDRTLAQHMCTIVSALSIQKAQEQKTKHVTIFAVGLGDQINDTFLQNVASGRDFYYKAPSDTDLQALFQRVAREIKLRLVQ
jgi:hypothetical protein